MVMPSLSEAELLLGSKSSPDSRCAAKDGAKGTSRSTRTVTVNVVILTPEKKREISRKRTRRTMLKKVLLGSLGAALVLTAGILLGHFGIQKGSTTPGWVMDVTQDVDEALIQKFIAEVDNIAIQENLRELTKVPHMATSTGDEKTVQYMLKRWQDPDTGLDQAWREEYKVYLSFPDPNTPNKVTVVSPSDAVLYTAREKEKAYSPDQEDPEVVQPYAAYAPAGHPKGRLVYANQGKPSDYLLLNQTLDLTGTIAITRYGGEGRAGKNITGIPPIPTQPIGFEDAYALICALGGEAAPSEWQGAFKCTYNLGGPGFKPTSTFNNSDVKLDIYNREELKNSANVMGVIRGSVEPDRYVIYGNHRDSWVHGAIDPSSGTSVMLEVTRVLGRMVKQANATLRASGSPSAQSVILKASKQVKTPGSDSTSVYDNWIRYFNRTSPTYGVIPNVGFLTGAGSDYAAFIHFLGITSMDISYTYDRTKTRARIYPAYHTAYDTFDYSSKFIDPGNVLMRLADSLLLPFNCSDYAETLEGYLNKALELYTDGLAAHSISIKPLKDAVSNFRFAAASLDKLIRDSDLANETPLKVRRINDQLMLLDRAFLDPVAFPDRYGFRHVIWASSNAGQPTFPGLADAYARATSTGLDSDWKEAHRQLSTLIQAIQGAAHTLGDVI
ncbi:unnamed protein product [Coregonus sp. 'balchen']|nr:unnamed protein product [Coregonus sp. 'balchen']